MTSHFQHTLHAAIHGQAPTSVTARDLTREAAMLREALRWSPFFRRRRVCRILCALRDEPMSRWWHHKEAAGYLLANMGSGS